MDQFIEQLRTTLEGQIDFEGQKLAETLTYGILSFAGILAFIIGYMTQNIAYILWITLVGTAVAFVAIVPPWPMYRKNPVQWLSAQPEIDGSDLRVDGKKIS